MNDVTPIPARVRDINTITAEIHTIQATVRRTALEGCIERGRRLVEAKELLPHGEWGQYLKEEFDWSQDRAGQLMKLFREYGAEQQNIFGAELNSDTYRNLSFSQALKLIAIPESEREDFVKENDVGKLTTRELDELIKEHNRQLAAEQEKTRQAEAESREAHAALDGALARGRAEGESAAAEKLAHLNTQVAEADKAAKQAEKQRKAAEKELAKAKADAEAARQDLRQLKDNPQVPQETMDKLRAQFSAAAQEAEARAAELEQRLKTADPTVAVFKVHFDNVQREFSTMLALIASAEAETGNKLRAAVAAVLDKFKQEVGN